MNGDLEEEVYMSQAQVLKKGWTSKLLVSLTSLYGLKQSLVPGLIDFLR